MSQDSSLVFRPGVPVTKPAGFATVACEAGVLKLHNYCQINPLVCVFV